jgi:penicillin-binding protein 1A
VRGSANGRSAATRNGAGGSGPRPPRRDRRGPQRPTRPRLKKLRLLLILFGLSVLAVISTVFGMMMAVASDLPNLENQAEYEAAENSTLLAEGDEIAQLTGNQHRILLEESEVSPMLKNAIIAVEDQRFYEHEGVDYLGIGRAFFQDVLNRSVVQGGSTITQQFVKNALAAQGDRSVFQKLRETALAYHLEREWTKQKILTQYLNSVYFGNGAYGVESAMRTYFGDGEYGPDERLSTTAEPHQAALLAGIIASPAAYDPVQNPKAARERRDAVLQNMLEQGYLTQEDYESSIKEPLPQEKDVDPPELDSEIPYYTTWVTQQLVDRFGAGKVFGGGLEVTTTIDPSLQGSAESAVESLLAGVGPSAAVVTIENQTGEVKAMVGGDEFDEQPFNLATNGHRQPGSAIKPFTLIAALEEGVSPEDTFTSEEKTLPVPGHPNQAFTVENYEGSYSGVATLRDATTNSDNSVYAELGLDVGTKRIAEVAEQTGIETKLSTNPAMTLGGLEVGVTPLEMAFAFSTIANGGVRRSGDLASSPMGPVGIERVDEPNGQAIENQPEEERVYSEEVGVQARELLTGVVTDGTATAAQLPVTVWGKTGTTENYGDAWFVGSTEECTTAVWVGYPEAIKPMRTEFNGQPVAGGTFPTEIWQSHMAQAIELEGACQPDDDELLVEPAPTETAPVEPAPTEEVVPTTPVEPTETAPVEPTETVPVEPTTTAPTDDAICGPGEVATVTGCVPG